ncbi:helix-turn-helix domain-containing protein, partial [Streptococcus pneumoniae]
YSDYVLARHTAMFFINKSCFESLLATGKIFNRDHTSVIHAIRNVRNMIECGHTKYIELVQSISDTIKQNIKQAV